MFSGGILISPGLLARHSRGLRSSKTINTRLAMSAHTTRVTVHSTLKLLLPLGHHPLTATAIIATMTAAAAATVATLDAASSADGN